MHKDFCPFLQLTISFAAFYNSNNEHFEQDSSGIFWDNDSLAALLALELKADLLVLLSDVDGLYSGPPSDPQSKLIHTYVKAKHQTEITFGDKSRLGRGGMTAKVKAAVHAANAGIPVIIAGYGSNLVCFGLMAPHLMSNCYCHLQFCSLK